MATMKLFLSGLRESSTMYLRPPLRRFQADAINFTRIDDHNWPRLFDSIRNALAKPAPNRSKRIVRMKYGHTSHFVGREETLNEVHEKLWINPTAALTQGQVQAVTALGGVGKTTLAREYADRFWRLYLQAFWVDCKLDLEIEFAGIFDLLFPDRKDLLIKIPDKARQALDELNQFSGRPMRLLVLDNALNQDAIANWIPHAGRCHTLITSRFAGWTGPVQECPVWVFQPETARLLLVSRSGRCWDELNGSEQVAVDELAKKLGYLPLALEQAAAFMANQTGYGFGQYLRELNEDEPTMLAQRTPGSTDYPDSVYTTWRKTIDRLPFGSRTILRLSAFFAPASIPLEMFVKSPQIIAERMTVLTQTTQAKDLKPSGAKIRTWRNELVNYSMIKAEPNDAFSVHALVQAVERHETSNSAQADWIFLCCKLFQAFAPISWKNPPGWPTWSLLELHALVLGDRALGQNDAENGGWLLNESANFCQSQGRYSAAEPLFRQALEARERLLGRDHPYTLLSANNLALLLNAKGDFVTAEPLYRWVLEANDRVQGREHPETLNSANNLASLLHSKGDLAAAEPLCRWALAARERVLGTDHPDTLISVNNLACILQAKGDLAAAEPLCHRALVARESVLGNEHPSTLISVNNLAFLLRAKGDLAAAEPLYRRTLEAHERLLDMEHPSTLSCVNNLAYLVQAKGDLAAAESLYRRALEGFAKLSAAIGREHPTLPEVRRNYGALLRQMGRTEQEIQGRLSELEIEMARMK
jgi:tetratricopeptide (TPR) repeat protein